MPQKKLAPKSKNKKLIAPLNTETEDTEKELDHDLIAGEAGENLDESDAIDLMGSADDSEFDEDELNPFKDKWEE